MGKEGFVYIMASKRNGTLYIGVTSNLLQRAYQHRHELIDGFTKRYGCKTLVWFDGPHPLESVRLRELQMKKWNRAWKLRLIEERNPAWRDLYDDIVGRAPAQAGAQERAALPWAPACAGAQNGF